MLGGTNWVIWSGEPFLDGSWRAESEGAVDVAPDVCTGLAGVRLQATNQGLPRRHSINSQADGIVLLISNPTRERGIAVGSSLTRRVTIAWHERPARESLGETLWRFNDGALLFVARNHIVHLLSGRPNNSDFLWVFGRITRKPNSRLGTRQVTSSSILHRDALIG